MVFRNVGLLLIFCIILSGCTPQLSKYFDSTRYKKDFSILLTNDNLGLSLQTPGDLRYQKDKRKLVQEMEQQHFPSKSLVAYGETFVRPYYKFFLWVDPVQPVKPKAGIDLKLDTLLKDHKIVLLCRADKASAIPSSRTDCRWILQSMSADTAQS